MLTVPSVTSTDFVIQQKRLLLFTPQFKAILLGRPFCSDTLCFSFVDSRLALGLTLSLALVQLYLALFLKGQANSHITPLK